MDTLQTLDFLPAASGAPEIARLWLAERLPGQLGALLGPRGVLKLYPWLVAPALFAGEHILVADGGNSFNPYDLGRIAEWTGLPADGLLRKVHISRAFTCHQMLALVRKIPEFASRQRIRLVLLPGLLDTFYDESIPAKEAKRLWLATLESIGRLASKGFLLLAVCPEHPMERKRAFRRMLEKSADRILVLRQDPGEKPALYLSEASRNKKISLSLPECASAVWRSSPR